ncbi:hypothetical protein Lser_V15G09733 [Lactuca serriola]
MTKKPRIPEGLRKLFKNRARTLAETILSLIPPPSSATVQLRCTGSQPCLHCCSHGDRMSFLLREDDPSDYCKLLNQCFVVASDIASSPPYSHHHSRWSQLEIVTRTIEMMLCEKTSTSTENMIWAGYNNVGDGLMVYLLKNFSIFIQVDQNKHHQVAGTPINDMCWKLLKYTSNSISCITCYGCNVKASVTQCGLHMKHCSNCNTTSTSNEDSIVLSENGAGRKRARAHAWLHRHKRRKLLSQNHKMCDHANPTSPHKIRKHIINSLKPNVAGGNALFKEIFGSSDDQLTLCSHSKDICGIGTTCLYHSLHKHLKLLIGRAKRCPRSKILKKHILDKKDLYCSKGQVVSFIWAASRSIVPEELLGNLRPLRKNISKFIKLRLYEKFSLHECMHKLKISDFSFLSNKHSLCDFKFGEIRGIVLERWMYWFFTHLIVPLIQANFYVTESEHGKPDVFYYEKSVWENLMKSSVSILKDKCYTLLDVNDVKKIISKRRFGFSRVRFRPKQNGMMRPLANLKSSSTLPNTNRTWTAVNVVLRDLHAALKDLQLEKAEKLGSSVFSYNDVHRKLRDFLTGVKSGLGGGVYMVVADVQKAYDSIDQDKLVDVMKDVITDDHLLHHTQTISISSKRKLQISLYINSSTQFRSYPSSHTHSILVDTKLLMRFIDDFLFISTSKKHVVAFLSRLGRGFMEYNCEMNKEKFGVSFDCDMIMEESNSKSNRVCFDEDGNKKFLKWSGLLINCNTLEVQADYTSC